MTQSNSEKHDRCCSSIFQVLDERCRNSLLNCNRPHRSSPLLHTAFGAALAPRTRRHSRPLSATLSLRYTTACRGARSQAAGDYSGLERSEANER